MRINGKLSLGIAVLVVGILATAFLAACAPPAPAPPAEEVTAEQPPTEAPAAEKVLKVGVLGPYTGPSARVGEEFKAATQMAFEEINYTIGDYKIELVWIDSQSDPEKATRAYEDAIIRDGIQAGLINWHSSVAVACMEVVAKHKIPHFFGFGATGVVNEKWRSDPEKYKYWIGKTWPMPEKLVTAYVDTLEEYIAGGGWEPRNRKTAIYGEDTDWGRSFGAALAKELKGKGWEVVAEEYFSPKETEFYPVLTKFKNLDVSLIGGTVAAPPSFAALIKQAKETELKALVIADGLGWVGEWYELTGDASDYVLDQIPQWTTPEAKEFRDKFIEKWGTEPSPSSAGLAYDAVKFFIKIAQVTFDKYGELNSETLMKTGEEVQKGDLTFTEGIIMEEYKFTPDTVPDPIVGKGYYIFPVIQYFKGAGKIIWPPEWKEADLQIPPGV